MPLQMNLTKIVKTETSDSKLAMEVMELEKNIGCYQLTILDAKRLIAELETQVLAKLKEYKEQVTLRNVKESELNAKSQNSKESLLNKKSKDPSPLLKK